MGGRWRAIRDQTIDLHPRSITTSGDKLCQDCPPLLHNRLFMDFSLLSSPIKTCLYTLKSCIIIGMVHRARTIRPRGDDCASFRIPPRPVSFQISAFGSWYITKPASCQKVSYLSWLCDSQQLKCRWMLIDLALILSAGSIRE